MVLLLSEAINGLVVDSTVRDECMVSLALYGRFHAWCFYWYSAVIVLVF